MTIDFDHGCGLLSPEDQEKMESILTERLESTHGAPGLHGMLTASVVGPKPVPLDWIVQAVLSHPQSEAIALDHLPEFRWLVGKIEEWFLRMSLVFQQDPEMFRPLVYIPNLKEGDTTPDPRSWCLGFVEAMMYHRKAWEPLFSIEGGFLAVAPILMTADPDGWGEKDGWNPFKQMAQQSCARDWKWRLGPSTLFGLSTRKFGTRSERQLFPTGMTRVPAAAAENISAVVEAR
jgi:yecA family protein